MDVQEHEDIQFWLQNAYLNECIVLFGKQSIKYVDMVRVTVIQHNDSEMAKGCSIIQHTVDEQGENSIS